ncbi:hypothetical protein Poli38472_001978 [Pythium oligandrum]|uniref:Uncharacterized protein n=1 Tax=Pythium oligandrum TaxID=41045 RepID=A0A8K1CVS5_PYTOL|nr:hypothetical protein Poli38472_001978 [Pythium oligandrum]|eukprot:TMW69822.1 hypothetical protein Poli38472_001978 [Pythium oligandrum]
MRLSWRCLVDGFSACGIRGVYFDEGFLIRELIEIGIQTYQAYRISYLVPQGWVSQLAVCVVVLNCWTTPLLHFAFVFFASNHDRHEPLRRVLCLATDIVLDFFSSMIIPFLIYSSYRSQILKNRWHDPLWALRVGNDLLCFYLSNVWDVGFRLLPNFSMLTCLGAIQPLFRPRGIPRSHPSFRNQFQVRRSHQPSSRLWVVHGFLAVYGFAILIISSAAYRKVHQFSLVGCHSTTRSWFATKYPCAVLELNCFRHNWTGSANELDSTLELADERTIAAVVITHCRQLEMPSQIQKFKNLVWLEVFNSTIAQWHDDAALSSFHHHRISRLMLIHVNVSMFPTRALADEFPPTLIDLEFVHTNLSLVFPSAPGRSWPSSIYRLYLEYCGLVETPPVLTSLRVATLSLAGNALQSFPSTLVDNRRYRQLSLAQNPIQSLPNAVWAVTTLHLEGTLVSSLPPSLMNSSTTTTILATQTPLCSMPPPIPQLDCALSTPDGAFFPLELYQVGRQP